LKRGDEIEAVIEDLAVGGNSVARAEGLVLFVRGGVPGDRVKLRVRLMKKKFAEADLVGVVLPSPHRTAPRCVHFGTCGGCTWQHIDYAAQLEFKRRHVADALARLGGFSGLDVPPPIGADEPYYYRNKMEFSFGPMWRTQEEMAAAGEDAGPPPPALGLHIPGRFDRVLDLRECHLQSLTSARLVNFVRAWAREGAIPVYSTFTQEGYLRNLVIREARRTGERMVNLVTADDRPGVMQELTRNLLAEFPGVTTVVNNITSRRSQVAVGERERVYHGTGRITERIGERSYSISANSFFQTNTLQAERLYDTALRFAALRAADTVYDLYSGTGTIALHVSSHAARVIGIESVADAVADARRNAAENGVTNCAFLEGDLNATLAGREAPHIDPPDVVIVDPPRAGLHANVARKIAALGPRTVVYVSCNPATQARDLKIICDSGKYVIAAVQPVDMFPHTYHVENVVGLAKSFQ